MKKIEKDVKKMSRAFTTVKTQLQKLNEGDSNLYESEDEYEASHFQMANIIFCKSDFQFAQLDKEFKPRIANIFNQTDGRNVGININLGLREVILLDSQLTMDFF